jgi:hypothetical protein
MNTTDPLNQMPVVPLLPTVRVGGSLLAWLRQRDFLLCALVGALCLSLVLNLVQSVLLMMVVKKRVIVFAIDPAKNMFLAEGQPLSQSQELHQSAAQDATDTLLARDPAGFRYLARLPRLFSRVTQDLAQQLRLNEEADFTQRQLRQTPEIARIEVRTSTWSGVEVVVTGRLERSGQLAGQPVQESVPFTLKLTFTPNLDLLQATRYPLIVTDFNLTYL